MVEREAEFERKEITLTVDNSPITLEKDAAWLPLFLDDITVIDEVWLEHLNNLKRLGSEIQTVKKSNGDWVSTRRPSDFYGEFGWADPAHRMHSMYERFLNYQEKKGMRPRRSWPSPSNFTGAARLIAAIIPPEELAVTYARCWRLCYRTPTFILDNMIRASEKGHDVQQVLTACPTLLLKVKKVEMRAPLIPSAQAVKVMAAAAVLPIVSAIDNIYSGETGPPEGSPSQLIDEYFPDVDYNQVIRLLPEIEHSSAVVKSVIASAIRAAAADEAFQQLATARSLTRKLRASIVGTLDM